MMTRSPAAKSSKRPPGAQAGTKASSRAAWERLSYTHRREHVRHIEEAKRPETRLRRIGRSVEALAAGRKEAR